ncbi:MAG: InlB B-repeat-containing protein, partial [Clostridiales bacterium]|nr:InlB B-repeat-containing protein [Clostridiales bacterium]
MHDNTTGFFTSSKDNWTRVGTNLKIITTNKATLRSNINTAGVSWVQTVSTRTPVNGTDAAAIGTTGPGKGLIPQSWYYSSGWDDFAGKYENAFNLLVDPKAVQTDIDYGAINLSNSYANLSIKLADSTSDYYGIVYNTTTSLPIDGISGLNTSYYSTNNPYTALKNISFLITAASEGSTYNIYYNGETALTDILQFWPDKKEYYTQETRNALEGALSDAVAVRSMGYNTLYQPTIDRAARNLQAAIENLRFAPLDTTSANVAYSSANIIWSYSPVYNPFTVTDRYAYTSMSGTTYTATLPSGTSVYTYTLASRNAASLAYNAVGAYVLNPSSYDTRDQDTLALKVTALNNALNNLAHGNVISTYWTQTVALIDTIPLASLNSEHRAVVEALLTEGNNIAATGTTDNQARLNVLTDTLFLYLYTEPADFTAIDAAIMNASHRSNKITAVNPVGQGRTTLNYYTAQSRTALQDTIDLAESKRPVFDGEGNPISVELPIIDKSATMSLASSISTATANLSVAGADFYFVNQQVTSGPACNSSHYTAQSWLVYITAYNRVAAALQASGASESTNWQATSTSAQFLATNQAGENGPDALATELFAARNALVHKNTTVTFKLNYGSNETYTTQTGLSGDETVTIPSAPTRTGYVFSGWYSDADCTNLVTLPQPFPLADTVYYAKWVSANYTVTFDGNGNTGGSMTPQSIPFASSAQLKANGFIKAGHLFIGWSTTSDGEVEYTDGTNYTMNSEGTTLYAVWSINSYQIIYIIDEVEYRRVTYQYGAPVTPIADPTKPGHTFSGWPQHPETMPAGDLTIMGSFSKNLYDLVYMIDGEIYKTETYEYDAEITPLPDPERTGSSFSGWSPIPARMPIGDFTVTGTFTENFYNIFFYLEGSLYKKLSYTYNSVIVPPEIPEREGYHFSGWSNLPATMPANPVITNGAYIINTYNAVFMVDGEVYATVPTNYNASIALPANPEKPGHTFNGWDDVPQLMPAGDVIINATWGTQEYTVTFY